MARYLRGFRHLIWVTSVAIVASSSALAVDLAKETGLKFAPQDADFYLGNLRLSEQWKALVSSKFVGELLKVPYIERAKEKFLSQWDGREGEIGRFRDSIENPQADAFLRLVKDMFSEEIFVFGDARNSEFLLEVDSLAEGILELMSKSEGKKRLNISSTSRNRISTPFLSRCWLPVQNFRFGYPPQQARRVERSRSLRPRSFPTGTASSRWTRTS